MADISLPFDDWTSEMMNLSARLHRLPPSACGGPGDHEVGIDRFASLQYGQAAIAALCQFAGELSHRPSADELVAICKAWLAHKAEMALFRRSRASQGRLERQQAKHFRVRFNRRTFL